VGGLAPPPLVPGAGLPIAGWEDRRGAAGARGARLARAEALAAGGGAAAGPLALLVAVLRHQESVTGAAGGAAGGGPSAGADERLAAGTFPLLDLDAAAGPVVAGIPGAVAAIGGAPGVAPDTLAAAGPPLAEASELERMAVVDAWLEDPLTVDALAGFWVGVAAGPVLEGARALIDAPSREQWAGRACPACGGLPQVSVIAPESGEFMGGSPRFLVCGRCAGWWTFPRAVCAWCGEDDPRKLAPFVADSGAARIDACETCGVYVKTFDLRQAGATAVVPLVDDVATLALDLWAREQGLSRPVVSMAGV
jgi:formate dehydrogenase formation protein